MAFFDWSDAFSVGIPSLGRQHRELVGMLNRLHAAMQPGEGQQVLGEVLGQLAAHCVRHFGEEERLLARFGYPELAGHREIHRKMTAKVASLWEEFQAGRTQMALPVANFLKGWLGRRILQTDPPLRPLPAGAGSGLSRRPG